MDTRVVEGTDAMLIAALRAGEHSAGEVLARRYYPRVVGVCLRYLRCPVESHDIAQDVFMKVLGEKKILLFRGQSQLWTWLYKVTVNACKNALLRRGRLWRREFQQSWGEGQAEHPATVEAEAERAISASQSQEFLQQALEALPEKYRQVIQLVCLEECTYLEAASRLRVPPRTVGVQVMRGKHLLAKVSRSLFAGSREN